MGVGGGEEEGECMKDGDACGPVWACMRRESSFYMVEFMLGQVEDG